MLFNFGAIVNFHFSRKKKKETPHEKVQQSNIGISPTDPSLLKPHTSPSNHTVNQKVFYYDYSDKIIFNCHDN